MPLGRRTLAANMAAAGAQVLFVGLVSMSLLKSPVLNRLAAATGFIFVGVMFALTLAHLSARL